MTRGSGRWRGCARRTATRSPRWTSLAVVERVLAGDAPVGYQTPAKAYGADFVLEIEG